MKHMACWLGIAMGLAWGGQARAFMIFFTGPESIHLSGESSLTYGAVSCRLNRDGTDIATGVDSIAGPIRDVPGIGQHIYRLYATYRNEIPTPPYYEDVEVVKQTETGQVSGAEAWGSAMFPEIIESLGLTNCRVGGGDDARLSFIDVVWSNSGAAGTVELSGNVGVEGCISFMPLYVTGSSNLTIIDSDLGGGFTNVGPFWVKTSTFYSSAKFLGGKGTLDECTFHRDVSMEAEVAADDCKFAGLTYDSAIDSYFNRCRFSDQVNVMKGAPTFQDGEFAANLGLFTRTATTIRNNVFLGHIYFWHFTDGSLQPIIEGNAFMGPTALSYDESDELPTHPIPIGANYYGSKFGPWADDTSPGFLDSVHHNGARIDDGRFDSGDEAFTSSVFQATTSLTRKDKRVRPKYWLQDWIVGQNTIPHTHNGLLDADTGRKMVLLQDKPTLLSLDVICSDTVGSDLKFYAEWNGEQVKALPRNKLGRDRSLYDWEKFSTGYHNVNFILPPVETTQAQVKVYVDATGLKGFDAAALPAAPELILSQTFAFTNLPSTRRLHIRVTPIQFYSYIWGSNALPDSSFVADNIFSVMPSMFPIQPRNVQVTVTSPWRIHSELPRFGSLVVQTALSCDAADRMALYNAKAVNPADLWVLVFPTGYIRGLLGIGKGEGSNYALSGRRRRIVMLDESTFLAVFHEIGHAVGLYTWREQYVDTPPNGIIPSAVTAFMPKLAENAVMPYPDCIRHFDGPGYSWYNPELSKKSSWSDIMGAEAKIVWPIIGPTLRGYENFILSALMTNTAPTRSGSAVRAAPRNGARRVFASGEFHRHPSGNRVAVFSDGTLRGFNYASYLDVEFPAATNGLSDARHLFKAYDATNGAVLAQEFYLPPMEMDEGEPDLDFWQATFDVPAAAVRYEVVHAGSGTQFLAVASSGALTTRLDQPAPGATLGESFAVNWTATRSDTNGSPLLHVLLFSPDGGATWSDVGYPVPSTGTVLRTDFLPQTTNLTIRLLTSDGLNCATSQVDRLRVPNHPPRIFVASPRSGDEAETNVLWNLSATVSDLEDGPIETGRWESSRDGVLGSNLVLLGVALSPGDHVLTCSVADSAGTAVSTQLAVHVGTLATIDLGWDADALQLRPPQQDPMDVAPLRLDPAGTNLVEVFLRNAGIETTCGLELYVRPAGGAESLLAQTNLVLDPFAVGRLAAEFQPTAFGQYDFSAVLASSTPADRNAANDRRTWTFATRQPVFSADKFVAFRYGMSPGGSVTPQTLNGQLWITNAGSSGLLLGAPTITGTNASSFSATVSRVSGKILAPGASTNLPLFYFLQTAGLREATLEIPSNDPDQPVFRVALIGHAVVASELADADRDGLNLYTENRLGTDPALADTDGDGLSDGTEDANRNGIHDPGETDPLVADSDGDGQSDGAETAAGTDPLDDTDAFAWSQARPDRSTGNLALQWFGNPGFWYRIYRASSVTAAWTVVEEMMGTGSTIDFQISPTNWPQSFFRLDVRD